MENSSPPSPPLYLGIEIGGTKLQLGLGRGDGTLLALERRTVEPRRGGEGIRAEIVAAYGSLLGRGLGRPTSAGIGFGGPVDSGRGRVTVSNQIDGWAGFPLVDWTRETLGIPRVSLRNDADTAALGEARHGAGVGFSPVLYVTIGSGIGGGLVVDGRIYEGAGLGAVEIGHLLVEDDPEPLSLEGIASGWSIGREARSRAVASEAGRPLIDRAGGDPGRIDARLVADLAGEGDPLALLLLDRATRAMAKALASAATLLAPARIILGGGVSLIGESLWLGPIRAGVDRRVFGPFRGSFSIVGPALGEEVVVHGAIALASDLDPYLSR